MQFSEHFVYGVNCNPKWCERRSCKSCHSWYPFNTNLWQIDNYFGNTMDSALISKSTFPYRAVLHYEVSMGLEMFTLCERQLVGSLRRSFQCWEFPGMNVYSLVPGYIILHWPFSSWSVGCLQGSIRFYLVGSFVSDIDFKVFI